MSIENAPAGTMQDWSSVGAGDKKKIGLVLVHGFTGSPLAMRPMAEFFNQLGYTVSVPLLPGHGTTPHDLNLVKWQQWPAKVEGEINRLAQSCDRIFVIGLSMGGGTTLNVAARYSQSLAGIILINPMIHVKFVPHQLAWAISRVQKLRKSVGDDIKRPGITEYGYDALPAVGVYELLKMLNITRKQLKDVTVPVQLFHSTEDHTLPVTNTEIIMAGIGSSDKQRIELTNSYHVATLDYDQDLIHQNAKVFIEAHS